MFVHESRVAGFVADVFGEWWRILPTITRDPEYASIINDKNFECISGLVDEAFAAGTQSDAAG
ncbi:hypothetical protein [Nocardia sp. NPDC059239]|uniref:hypothetical protein n=1 Tax=unclassified Nocardia TaxID=2637762 RepID=UPI0036A2ACC7